MSVGKKMFLPIVFYAYKSIAQKQKSLINEVQ